MRLEYLFVAAGIVGTPATAWAVDVPIAYVRCDRTTEDLTLAGGTTLTGIDIYDVLPDVTNFFGGWNAPCDLVLREPDGTERVLYDCSTESTDAASCTAMDPAVSFDGETIAFSVFHGPLTPGKESFSVAVGGDGSFVDLPSDRLQTAEAQLVLVDVASGELTELPHVPGTIDAGPAWLPDGRLAFTSTRDGNRTTMVFGTNSPAPGSRIWTVDPDGRNLDLASHHSLSQEQHPLPLADGRVAYSSWQIFGGITFRYTNGSPGGFGTIGNQFSIFAQAPDGAEPFAFYGQHCGDHGPITSANVDHKAAHFLAQTSDGRVWFTDYYRGNNNGLGNLVGVMPEAKGLEGILDPTAPIADLYAPHDIVRLATWSTSSDNFAGAMPAPELMLPEYADPIVFAGKLGHAGALPDGGLAVTWGKGACGTVASNDIFTALGLPVPPATSGSGQGVAANVFTQLGLDTPACDAGIYEVTASPSVHPSDLDVVIDTEEWHEIMPRAVVPYAAIHGIERPAAIPRADLLVSRAELSVGTPFGLLGAASILDRETHPVGGIHFAGEHQFHLQGTDTVEYDDDDLCGVRILGVQPNRGDNTYQQIANVAGERVVILGEFGVRNQEGGVPLDDPSGNPDTSFLVRFPANVPYLMQGIDCDGHTLNTDQSWQSLRPGEMKTCGGCHVHSKAARVEFDETFAAGADYPVIQLGEGMVPLLAGAGPDGPAVREVDGYALAIDFEQDILPIFAARCNSCHSGASPAGSLALDVPGTAAGSTWDCLVADRGQACVPEPQRMATENGTTFRRPQLTRYLRAFNSLGSPLYWKAAGMRTDGNTDATFDDASAPEDRDLDFGAAHPTEITADELGLLGRWIDIGAPGGPEELTDTQRPTLTLAALHDDETVTALRVGTVDIPSGIDVDSLVVCIVDAAGTCTTMLAEGGAMPHDVLEIPLDSPLSDHDVEVLARVRDVAGNETEVRRTVRWLLDSPLPPDPGGVDTGSDEGGVDSTAGGDMSASGANDAGTGGSDGEGGANEGDGGCGCTTEPRGSFGVWLLCVLLGLRRRAWLGLALGGCAGDGDGDAEASTTEASAGTGADDVADDDAGPGPGTTVESSGAADDADTSAGSEGSDDGATTGGAGGCGPGGGGDGGGGPFAPNPELDALADNTALDLGAYECASRMPQIADNCTLITDYSRLNYDPYVHRVLMFGGGHAATGRTDVDVLDPTTLAWASLYPSMSCDDVALGDLDPRGFHAATGHPVARHTYDQTIVAEVDGVGQLMMFSTEGFAGYCHQYDVSIQSVASLQLDAACTTWEHSEQFALPWAYASTVEFDPVSGLVIMIGDTAGAGEGGMWVWDPATHEVVTFVDEVEYDGIAANLVYFPPNERMYYFSTDGIVREIALDRANWAATTSTVVAASGPVPPGGETGYAYDSRNQVIGGAVFDDTFHVFDPVAQMWCADAMQVVSDEGAAIGTGTFHELDYDPVDNVYLLVADGPAGRRTWAYRWRA